jgi:hypothetical protein
MRRLALTFLVLMSLVAPGSAQMLPPWVEELFPPPDVDTPQELIDYYRSTGENEADALMWEAYQATEGLPDEELPEVTIPDTRTPGDQTEQAFPLRGMFYYPWYPESWTTPGPHFTPARGANYSQDSPGVIEDQVQEMIDAGVDVGISSWLRDHPRDARFADVLAASVGKDLTWALYYEREGVNGDDPSWQVIRDDLRIITSRGYATHSNYLRIGGKPVIFVFADAEDACGDGDAATTGSADPNNMVERWAEAVRQTSRRSSIPTPNFHVVLKVFDHNPASPADYLDCPRYPGGASGHSFHQYAPAAPTDQIHRDSYVISPGFWKYNEAQPRLGAHRDLVRWRQSIRNMEGPDGDGKEWHLITTYNEWGEGSQVEASTQLADVYLEALATDGVEPVATGRVMGAGDNACEPPGTPTSSSCHQLATSDLLITHGATLVLPLGDTQYECGQLTNFNQVYASSWGRPSIKNITRPSVGNHEYLRDDLGDEGCTATGAGNDQAEGYFDYFNGVGTFTGPAGDRDKGYHSFNHGGWHFIALNSMCTTAGARVGCNETSEQYGWLELDLDNDPGRCEIAYMHHPRWSLGTKVSEGLNRYDAIWQLLVDRRVDLLLVGHDHNYQRFPPLDGNVGPGGANVDRGFGLQQLIIGTGGKNLTPINTAGTGPGKPNAELITWNGSNGTFPAGQDNAFGVLQLDLRPNDATYTFRPDASSGNYTDAGNVTCLS